MACPEPHYTTYNFEATPFTAPTTIGKLDYAGNAGTTDDGTNMCQGPGDLATGDGWPGSTWRDQYHGKDTGVIYTHSATALADITDGTSNTYLLGEKYCNADTYYDGTSQADDQGWDAPADWDSIRFTGSTSAKPGSASFAASIADFIPIQDTPGTDHGMAFGSPHGNGFYMAFCDGSVQFMNYAIDITVHWYLGNRADGVPIDAKKL